MILQSRIVSERGSVICVSSDVNELHIFILKVSIKYFFFVVKENVQRTVAISSGGQSFAYIVVVARKNPFWRNLTGNNPSLAKRRV